MNVPTTVFSLLLFSFQLHQRKHSMWCTGNVKIPWKKEACLSLVAQPSWRYLQSHRLYIENTCKLQVEASIWKDIFWMWRFFFPVQRACYLDNSRRFVASGAERVSWACRGMAVPNKQALSLTVSRVLLLLLSSHCSPHPLPSPPPPLTFLPLFNIRLLFSRFVV